MNGVFTSVEMKQRS